MKEPLNNWIELRNQKDSSLMILGNSQYSFLSFHLLISWHISVNKYRWTPQIGPSGTAHIVHKLQIQTGVATPVLREWSLTPTTASHCEGGPYPHYEVDLPCTAHGPVKLPGFPCQVCQVHDRDPWQPLPHPWWPLKRSRWASYVILGGYIFLVRKYKNSQICANFTYRYQEWWLKLKFQRGRLFCLFSLFYGGLELIFKEPLHWNSKPDVGRNIRKFF